MTREEPGTRRRRLPEIERDISKSRVELGLTLEALERKLTARYLVKKGLDMFNDSFDGHEILNRSLDAVRANPVPFALIGIGAAWLFATNTGMAERLANDQRIDAARRRVGEIASDLGHRAGELAGDMASRVGLGGESGDADDHGRPLGQTGNPMIDEDAGRGADGWVHQVSGAAQGALRAARDTGGAMLGRAGSFAGDGAGRVADQFADVFERHPLVIGAIGVMAGALVASLLPVTRLEDQWLGGSRDELWHKAEEAGQDALNRVHEAAVRAAEAVGEAVTGAAQEVAHPPRG